MTARIALFQEAVRAQTGFARVVVAAKGTFHHCPGVWGCSETELGRERGAEGRFPHMSCSRALLSLLYVSLRAHLAPDFPVAWVICGKSPHFESMGAAKARFHLHEAGEFH